MECAAFVFSNAHLHVTLAMCPQRQLEEEWSLRICLRVGSAQFRRRRVSHLCAGRRDRQVRVHFWSRTCT